MNMTLARSRVSLMPVGFGVLALMLTAGLLAFNARNSPSQNADSDAASYASRLGQGAGSEYTTVDPASFDPAGAAAAADGSTSSAETGGHADFRWPVSLLILFVGFAAAGISWALLGPKKTRSRARRHAHSILKRS